MFISRAASIFFLRLSIICVMMALPLHYTNAQEESVITSATENQSFEDEATDKPVKTGDNVSTIPLFQRLLQNSASVDAPNADVTQAASQPEDVNQEATIQMVWQGSLMFDPKEAEYVRNAILSNEIKISLKDLIPELYPEEDTTIKEIPTFSDPDIIQNRINSSISPLDNLSESVEETPVETLKKPLLYLNSVAYFSASNWILWINGQKTSYGETHPDVSIAAVKKNQVAFVWLESKIDQIYPNWKDDFYPMEDERFWTNGYNIVIDKREVSATNSANEDVSKVKDNIIFMLYPHQTFDAASLTILEGKHTASTASPASTSQPQDSFAEDGSFFEGNAEFIEEDTATPSPVKTINKPHLASKRARTFGKKARIRNERTVKALQNLLRTY